MQCPKLDSIPGGLAFEAVALLTELKEIVHYLGTVNFSNKFVEKWGFRPCMMK
jgi:hypothetical protein